MNKTPYYFGIDLGTTNSVIAVYDGISGINYAIPVNHNTLLKSMVSLDVKGSNEFVVGKYVDGQSTVKDVKSCIGDITKSYTIGDKTITPIDVSALVLHKLKLAANEAFKGIAEVNEVTITVPAKFNHIQRTNTVLAAQKAGLKVVSLINEPTSAALAYVDENTKRQTALVYDLGGGTFDASIVDIIPAGKRSIRLPALKLSLPALKQHIVSVVCSDGDVSLGGNDLDDLIVQAGMQNYKGRALTEVEYRNARKVAQELKERELDIATYTVPGTNSLITFTSDDFISATNEIYARTKTIIDKLLREHAYIHIDRIILVGGSTKNKYIRANIRDDFKGIKIYTDINPDECVALGASKNSYLLLGDQSESSLRFYDVSSDSIGIQVMTDNGLRMEKMINKGTALPAKSRQKLGKSYEEQTTLTVQVYQGESGDCNYNTYLGEVSIDNLDKSVTMDTVLYCDFYMDANGIVTCTVTVNGKEYSVTINSKETATSGKTEVSALESMLDDMLTTEF